MQDLSGKWALITGASSGIGEEYARQFAALGMNLIIAARREDRLNSLAAEVRTQHSVEVTVFAVDLLADGQPAGLLEQVKQLGHPIEVLINNAGFGILSRVDETDIDQVRGMIDLNVRVLTQMTYELLPDMLTRGSGTVINLASVAAFQPTVYMSVYAATKTFVLHFSESLWAEVRDRGVHVLAVCPGPTQSEFFGLAGMQGWYTRLAHTPDDVVATTIRGMKRKKNLTVVGWLNRLVSVTPRFSARRVVIKISERILRPDRG